jgi:nucleoid-associated protein YgaU
MVRLSRGGAFWFFLLLLAVGIGWASNQQWRSPLLALFGIEEAPQIDPQQQAADEQPVPETEAPIEAAPADQPSAEASQEQAEPPADTAGVASPAAPAPEAAETEPGQDQPGVAEPAPGSPGQQQPAEASAGPAPELATKSVRKPASEPAETASNARTEPADSAVVATIEPGASRTEPEVETPAEAASPSAAATSKPGAAEPNPREEETAAVPDEPAPAGQPGAEGGTKPSFDIVRVEPDGRAVIAGRAAPGAEVELRAGDQVIDRVRASRRGEWVAIPTKPLSPGDQALTAFASREGTPPVESDEVVVVAVPEPTRPEPSGAEVIGEAEKPVAVLLPRDGRGAGRILQAPGRLSAEGTLALMTVSYDAEGKILLSGEAPPGVPVRIYVDNRPAAVVVGDAKGSWASGLDKNLEPGTYTLRLDQLDAKGQTVARIETPFSRVSEPPIEGKLQVDYVVVQPGNSLWRIARRLSGQGLDYVHIYGTNKTQIQDPDLIYPGQVFEIPSQVDTAG